MTISRKEDRANLLASVRGLIAKADDPSIGPDEADLFRKKADALMLKYRIEGHELKSDAESSRAIEAFEYDFSWYHTDPYAQMKWDLFRAVAIHCRMVPVYWKWDQINMPLVGTNEDFEYFDLLLTNIFLEMSNNLEPKPRRDEKETDYLVRAKEAGMKWERIAQLMIEARINTSFEVYERKVGVRFTKMYSDFCRENGRPQLKVMPKTYQFSFVKGFCAEMGQRLLRMRREAQAEYDAMNEGTGSALVLADIKTAVDARTRQMFGDPPPPVYGRSADNRKVDGSAFGAGREAARNMDIGARGVGTNLKGLPSG